MSENPLHDKGLEQIRSGRYKEAIQTLSDALIDEPDDFEIRLLLGIACGEDKDYDSSRDVFSSVIRLKPDHAPAHYGLGMAMEGLSDRESAVVSYKQALRLDPNYASALKALKRIHPQEAEYFARAGSFEEDSAPFGFEKERREDDASDDSRRYENRAEPSGSSSASSYEGPFAGSHALEWGSEALASPFQRWVAYLCDGFIIGLLYVIISLFGLGTVPLCDLILEVCYETYAIYEYGTTFGKNWMNLSVDSVDGSDVTAIQSFTRAIVKAGAHGLQFGALMLFLPRVHSPVMITILGMMVALPGCPSVSELWIFFNPRRQALHDLAAKTVVSH